MKADGRYERIFAAYGTTSTAGDKKPAHDGLAIPAPGAAVDGALLHRAAVFQLCFLTFGFAFLFQ